VFLFNTTKSESTCSTIKCVYVSESRAYYIQMNGVSISHRDLELKMK